MLDWAKEYGEGSDREALAKELGISSRRVGQILSHDSISFGIADRIITHLNVFAWFAPGTELHKIYFSVPLKEIDEKPPYKKQKTMSPGTHRWLAERIGVGHVTIGRVLRGEKGVASQATREKVLKAAREAGMI